MIPLSDASLRSPLVVQAESMNEALIHLAQRLLEAGIERIMDSYIMYELPSVCLVLGDPGKSVVTLPERDLNGQYLEAEIDWYESGSLWAEDIQDESPHWNLVANPNGTVNSNYGFLAFVETHAGESQFQWCAKQLTRNVYTNRAVINYNLPRHKYEGNADFPSVISQAFKYREDERLHTVVHSRSSDILHGLCYDVPWFVSVLAKLCEATQLPVGTYTHWIESLYVKDVQVSKIRAIAEAGLARD